MWRRCGFWHWCWFWFVCVVIILIIIIIAIAIAIAIAVGWSHGGDDWRDMGARAVALNSNKMRPVRAEAVSAAVLPKASKYWLALWTSATSSWAQWQSPASRLMICSLFWLSRSGQVERSLASDAILYFKLNPISELTCSWTHIGGAVVLWPRPCVCHPPAHSFSASRKMIIKIQSGATLI